jgi:hypothetical protein
MVVAPELVKRPFRNKVPSVFYCCVTDYYTLSLKQRVVIISWLLKVRSPQYSLSKL